MSRPSNLPDLPPVASFAVAPHRYLWTAPIADPPPQTWREVREAAPYKPGDVVFVVYGDGYCRAYVHAITCRRDGFGDLVEAYEIRRETRSGTFHKRAYVVGAGLVQRGYQRAGLAPEMPKDA